MKPRSVSGCRRRPGPVGGSFILGFLQGVSAPVSPRPLPAPVLIGLRWVARDTPPPSLGLVGLPGPPFVPGACASPIQPPLGFYQEGAVMPPGFS